jgi:hypothetical protein
MLAVAEETAGLLCGSLLGAEISGVDMRLVCSRSMEVLKFGEV